MHTAIQQVLSRSEVAKSDSDFTYFFSLLLAAEAVAKTIVAGMAAAIGDDKHRNRYRIEHALVRADGLGDWGKAIEDVLSGTASQHLLVEARVEQAELAKSCGPNSWQYEAVRCLKQALDHLNIESDALPAKTDMKRWFRLLVTLRNKTRAHGATPPALSAVAAAHLAESIRLVTENLFLFQRPWAFLHRNLSGKYRVSTIAGETAVFESLKSERTHSLGNGIYVYFGAPYAVQLMSADADLQDFFFANGGFNGRRFEFLSYGTDNKIYGDGSKFLIPPGTLPASETEGRGELLVRGNCLTNAPDASREYVSRTSLEKSLFDLLKDDRRTVVTLVGRGGIGKTSLALRVIQTIYSEERFNAVIWLSARDIDLHFTGPRLVRQGVLSIEDISKLYCSMVLSVEKNQEKGFNPRHYFEQQLGASDAGPCLFVFDNFETVQQPIEVFNWIDSFIRLPNKALITTRLRDFKGDYPVEVRGMDEIEGKALVDLMARSLNVERLVDESYSRELVRLSEGHPYVIKVLLGEVAKAGRAANIPQLVAGTEDILTALFERTYAALTPCAQRAFLTLSAWNSVIPRLALEAVLVRSTKERSEVEDGVETLLKFSMAEVFKAEADGQEFIGLPLVARVFGQKKLNVSAGKTDIQMDVSFLQMLGPGRPDDIKLGLARRLELLIANVARRVESGEQIELFLDVLEMICRSYNPGWLLMARWQMERRVPDGYQRAKEAASRFLENGPRASEAVEGWRLLGDACHSLNDPIGEVHASVERAQLAAVPFFDISNAANRLNGMFRSQIPIDKDKRRLLANRLLDVIDRRKDEASPDDLSRMAWLAINAGHEDKARVYTKKGLTVAPENNHCRRLAERLGL